MTNSSERCGCMCGHAPRQHNLNDDACDVEDCECERYREYDHSYDGGIAYDALQQVQIAARRLK
jgi:hypothetical protein